MTTHVFFTTLFLANLLHISLAFTCTDLKERQCLQLQKDGCIWSGSTCAGSYSPSCIPPNCYYVDSNSQSTETPDGTPGKPFKTLSDGFTEISGKDGLLMIINVLGNSTASVTRSSTLSSNITIKCLFEDKPCKIDFNQFTTFFGTALTIKNSLKLIGINLELNFLNTLGSFMGFNVGSGGRLYFENVEVNNATKMQVHLVKATDAIFSMVNCRFTDALLTLLATNSTVIWKNVSGSGRNVLQNTMSAIKSMIIEDCFFTGGLGGTFIGASSGGEILVRNCTFKDLTISPFFIIESRVKMTVADCIFDQMNVTQSNILTIRRSFNTYGVPFVIKNTSFTNIAVQVSLIYLEGQTTSLSLINVTMKNITKQTNPLGSLASSNQLSLPEGICCLSYRRVRLSVEFSNFSEIKGSCFGLRDTYFTLKSSILNNSGLLLDADKNSIVREDLPNLDDKIGVSWINMEQTTYFFGDIYQVFIQDSKFINNGVLAGYGGALRFRGVTASQIRITGSEFIGNRAYYGGAIYTENAYMTEIQLDNNIFVDNYAYHGGAIYKMEKGSGGLISINNTQFIRNKAIKNGGALYLNRDSLRITNTEFLSNMAVNGGALYYINLENDGEMRNVDFIENSASNVGGAMKLFFKYSQFKTEAVIFESNFDLRKQAIHEGRPLYYLLSFYDIMMIKEIENLGNLEHLVKNPKFTRLNFLVNISKENIQARLPEIKHKSGNELIQILQVQIFDSENKVADYIDDEEMSVEMVAYQNVISNYSASLVSSPLRFKFSNGQFFVKDKIKMHGEPKTTATLYFSNVKASSDFIQDSGMKGSFDFQVKFVDCDIGDIFDKSMQSCTACIEGSYSFTNPHTTSHCSPCPENIDCFGGDKIGPKSGYWMKEPSSLNVIKCPNPSACLGSYVDYEYSSKGKCLFPHQGNLCNQCAPNFAKFGSSAKCEDCKNNVEYYIKFVIFLLLQIAVILGLFKLNEKQDEKSTLYVNILKIFVSFIQINSIIMTYDLEWPSLTKSFIHGINSAIPVNHDGFAIDCLLSLVLQDNYNITFVKLIVTSFQPFAIWGFSILAYLLILLCSSEREYLGRKLRGALGRLFIISAFLVQPNVILTCLQLFSCQNFSSADDPQYFLTSNSEVRCWTGSHLIWSFGVALPLLLIWVVFLPLILFCKTRKFAQLPGWQPIFYQGLEKKRFYWEFIMLFVKTVVIILSTVLSSFQAEIQILGTFFICLSLAVLFLKLRPYSNPRLHGLGFFSLVTLTLDSYVGFFSSTDHWMGIQMTIVSVLLIVANGGLFILPAFYIIKDFTKARTLERTSQSHMTIEAQPQTEAEKLSGTDGEEQPKQTTNADVEVDKQVILRGEDDSPINENIEVCTELNEETKIGTVYHSKKESLDNFSIMQSSGLGLLSPLNATPSSRLLSPLCTSPTLAKQIVLSSTPKDVKGDSVLQKPIKRKTIDTTRINMKQFVMNELESRNKDTDKTVAETVTRSEIPSDRVQGELDNLLTASKMNKADEEEEETTKL